MALNQLATAIHRLVGPVLDLDPDRSWLAVSTRTELRGYQGLLRRWSDTLHPALARRLPNLAAAANRAMAPGIADLERQLAPGAGTVDGTAAKTTLGALRTALNPVAGACRTLRADFRAFHLAVIDARPRMTKAFQAEGRRWDVSATELVPLALVRRQRRAKIEAVHRGEWPDSGEVEEIDESIRFRLPKPARRPPPRKLLAELIEDDRRRTQAEDAHLREFREMVKFVDCGQAFDRKMGELLKVFDRIAGLTQVILDKITAVEDALTEAEQRADPRELRLDVKEMATAWRQFLAYMGNLNGAGTA